MSTTTQAKPAVSIFGSTGGCGLATLRFCLQHSIPCTVLVRSRSKLLSLLSLAAPPATLTIVVGSISDVAAVQQAILAGNGTSLVDVIVSCIGFTPSLTPSTKSLNPFANVDDQHVCEKGTRAILDAITYHHAKIPEGGKKPVLAVISTTGISAAGRDIPLLMTPLYHWMLATPHKDKKAMEDVLKEVSTEEQPWVVIRPSFLGGDGKGEPSGQKLRVGLEKEGKVETKAVGYTIKREDVGDWIFREVVSGDSGRWVGKVVTLTH